MSRYCIITFAAALLLLPKLSFSQHQLYFNIPECPNPSIISNNAESEVAIFPNPVSDLLTLNFQSESPEEIVLFDLSGKKYYLNCIKSCLGSYVFDVSMLENGVYFIGIKIGESYLRRKFVKL
jgi:hypothetical protein